MTTFFHLQRIALLLLLTIIGCKPSKVLSFSSPKPSGSPGRIRESSVPGNKESSKHFFFVTKPPPFLAVITEETSCDSEETLSQALTVLKSAVSSGSVDLVSVRVNLDDSSSHEDRIRRLISHLLQWRKDDASLQYSVVVSSDWMNVGLSAGADGIHFKESHRDWIQKALRIRPDLLIGTSTHSIDSALGCCCDVDYFFCGTCFPTQSHPEKKSNVEGPQLPAQVKAALLSRTTSPAVLAIGGIDATNARPQYTKSYYVPDGGRADGVATIRSVLQAPDPGIAAQEIRQVMIEGGDERV